MHFFIKDNLIRNKMCGDLKRLKNMVNLVISGKDINVKC
jgi:hypothetical protein